MNIIFYVRNAFQLDIYLIYLVDDFKILKVILDLTSATYQSLERIYLFPFSDKIFFLHNVANYLRSGRGAAVYGTLGGLPGIFTEATNFGPSPAAAALPAGHCVELKILWKHRTNTESNKASIHCGSEEFETKNIFPKKQKYISEIQIPSQHM